MKNNINFVYLGTSENHYKLSKHLKILEEDTSFLHINKNKCNTNVITKSNTCKTVGVLETYMNSFLILMRYKPVYWLGFSNETRKYNLEEYNTVVGAEDVEDYVDYSNPLEYKDYLKKNKKVQKRFTSLIDIINYVCGNTEDNIVIDLDENIISNGMSMIDLQYLLKELFENKKVVSLYLASSKKFLKEIQKTPYMTENKIKLVISEV